MHHEERGTKPHMDPNYMTAALCRSAVPVNLVLANSRISQWHNGWREHQPNHFLLCLLLQLKQL